MRAKNKIKRTITPGRLVWLQTLARLGIAHRKRGPHGFQCMQLGWTQWARSNGTETIGEDEFDRRFPTGTLRTSAEQNDPRLEPRWMARLKAYDVWKVVGEMLTDAGREALARWEKARA